MSLVLKAKKQVDDHYLIPADKTAEKKGKAKRKDIKSINMIGII